MTTVQDMCLVVDLDQLIFVSITLLEDEGNIRIKININLIRLLMIPLQSPPVHWWRLLL